MQAQSPTHAPAQSLPVYRAEDLCVSEGVNLGDALSFADELVLEDCYELTRGAQTARLSVVSGELDYFTIAPQSDIGVADAALHLDSCLTVMTPTGETIELLVLVEVDPQGNVSQIYVQPLAPLISKTPYTLVGIDRDAAKYRFAQVGCVSFTRGTRITTATGEQKTVEDLRVGDRILTRDNGPQKIRWIGQTTQRAVGEFAPIVISKGTLNNSADLKVSPDHRLFIYQRYDRIGAGRPELLVKARHLVNGKTVYPQEGGFVDYFQLLFDSHEIIYAEGISAETMLVDTRTKPVLPEELKQKLSAPSSGHKRRPHMDYEVHEDLLKHPDTAELLRRASTK